MKFTLWIRDAALSSEYYGMCHSVRQTATHDGSAGPQNKASLGQIVNLNQMGHFVFAAQSVVNVVSGSRVFTSFHHKYCRKADRLCVCVHVRACTWAVCLLSPNKDTDFVPISVDWDRCCVVIDLWRSTETLCKQINSHTLEWGGRGRVTEV